MKKTWTILCAAVLALSLAGCANDKTQGGNMTPSASPSPAQSTVPSAMPSQDIHGTDDSGDLAGKDGIVDGNGTTGNGVGNTDNDKSGQADNSALEEVGEGIHDTLDDLGDAARDAGRGARNMIEGR